MLLAGTAPKDHETLRQIASLLASLPASDSNEFKEEYMTVRILTSTIFNDDLMVFFSEQEYSDVLLTSYLATMTKELGPTNDVRSAHCVCC